MDQSAYVFMQNYNLIYICICSKNLLKLFTKDAFIMLKNL